MENDPVDLEKIFFHFVNFFCYFAIISPWKRSGPFKSRSFTQGCFVPSLVEIDPVVLEKTMKILIVNDNNNGANGANDDNDTNGCFVSSLVEIGHGFLRRRFLYPPWTKFRGGGGYRNHSICPSVCPSICSDSCPVHNFFFGLTLAFHIWHIGLSLWEDTTSTFISKIRCWPSILRLNL